MFSLINLWIGCNANVNVAFPQEIIGWLQLKSFFKYTAQKDPSLRLQKRLHGLIQMEFRALAT